MNILKKLSKTFIAIALAGLALTGCDRRPEPTPTYTVTWVVEGNVVEIDENVEKGSLPSYDGSEPSKDSSAEFTYSFNGWDKELVEVTEDVTYTATFLEVKRTYEISFIDQYSEEISSDVYEYGTSAEDIVIPTIAVSEDEAEYISEYYVLLNDEILDVTEDHEYSVTVVASATKAGCLDVANWIASCWGGSGTDAYWDTYGFCYTGANFGGNYTLAELMDLSSSALLPEPYFTVLSDFVYDEQYAEYDATYASFDMGVFVYVGVYNNGTEAAPKNTIAFQVTPIVL